MSQDRLKIGIVGGGISGIVSAYILSRKHEITIFDKNSYLGGHTNTVLINSGPDAGTKIDTGFIVLNDKTYPTFHAFLEKLSVPWRYSDMSFGFYSELSNLQYAGTNLNGMFADRKNIFSPSFLRFILEIKRFADESLKALEFNRLHRKTVKEFAQELKLSSNFLKWYLLPMAAAIWSSPEIGILDFPAQTLVTFFKNHGLLSFSDRPKWQTVVGGSRCYVEAFLKSFNGKVILESAISQIQRKSNKVVINCNQNIQHEFDKVIIATHADEAFSLLSDPTKTEKRLLQPWQYQLNKTILHTDPQVMPPKKLAWASWNFREESGFNESQPVSMTYYMNLLQGLKTQEQYFVTLNSNKSLNSKSIIADFNYMHPIFSMQSVATQSELNSNGFEDNIGFAGSYFGYGFHEDAVKSAVRLVKYLDLSL
ncbi:MAG: FAD-dependent oxidoreductase [bacterium]|nr:FAD-dependent oxidoreductase [bacterium]